VNFPYSHPGTKKNPGPAFQKKGGKNLRTKKKGKAQGTPGGKGQKKKNGFRREHPLKTLSRGRFKNGGKIR